jgi:DNA-binding NtrC family response regulator
VSGTSTSQRGRILVVEDDAYVRGSLREILQGRGFEVVEVGAAPEALSVFANTPLDALLTDLGLPGMDGLELVRRVRAVSSEMPIVVLTGRGGVASAVACLKGGANDYLLKPVDAEALELALERAMAGRALRREVHYLRSALTAAPEPLGDSPAWRRTLLMVAAASATDSTVLLQGESGTGKELLARKLHQKGPRAEGPYVRVNCAAVPTEMWESEFFGHRKGAFTGANSERDGRFQLAHGGTLFLDEVGAMPGEAQAKLLRVIQDGEFDRLGDERPSRVDVRIVAATNADLETEVKEGRFRADLYYRLNVLRIRVPPLRERIQDIPCLASSFAAEVAARLGRSAPDLDADSVARLQAYPWPGNVRELRSVIERALVLHPGRGLAALDLAPEPIGAPPGPENCELAPPDISTAPQGSGVPDLGLRDNLSRLERWLIVEAHRRSNGVRGDAARLLRIDARNLAYYFRKHQLDPGAAE